MLSLRPFLESRARSNVLTRSIAALAFLLFACSEGGDAGTGVPCPGGGIDCGECVDTSRHLFHCGACGVVCGQNQDCVGGECRCIAGLSLCGGNCVNTEEHGQHCGGCEDAEGANCAVQGLFCSQGVCATECALGLAACGASCVNLATSPGACGSCQNTCEPGQECRDGACLCSDGRSDCGSGCVELATDPLHCGRCGTVCDLGTVCLDGQCVVPPIGGSGGAPSSGGAPGTGGSPFGSGGAESTGGASTGGAQGETGGTGGTEPNGCGRAGFYVENKKLYDSNCREFILRGVNYPYVWYASRDLQADLKAIAATGANSVRFVLATGDRWERTAGNVLTTLISRAKAEKLISIVEVHDTTGYSEQAGSVPLSRAQQYWLSSDVLAALKGQEAYVLLNIANEPNGNNTTDSWASSHVTAVRALRDAGLEHTLMIDAPNWGQDWTFSMRDGAGAPIWEADGRKNLVFSVHMYDVYENANTISTYFSSFLSRYAAPLVVGEFAADHGPSANVDEDTILAYTESLGIGYLGWSWSGNSPELSSLDITQGFNPGSLTTWGNRLINGENGLKQTGEVCSCFE